jgi:hypothetical protein
MPRKCYKICEGLWVSDLSGMGYAARGKKLHCRFPIFECAELENENIHRQAKSAIENLGWLPAFG